MCMFLSRFSLLLEFLMEYLIHSGRVAVHEIVAKSIAVVYTAVDELI